MEFTKMLTALPKLAGDWTRHSAEVWEVQDEVPQALNEMMMDDDKS
jgi:hypothetical protein